MADGLLSTAISPATRKFRSQSTRREKSPLQTGTLNRSSSFPKINCLIRRSCPSFARRKIPQNIYAEFHCLPQRIPAPVPLIVLLNIGKGVRCVQNLSEGGSSFLGAGAPSGAAQKQNSMPPCSAT